MVGGVSLHVHCGVILGGAACSTLSLPASRHRLPFAFGWSGWTGSLSPQRQSAQRRLLLLLLLLMLLRCRGSAVLGQRGWTWLTLHRQRLLLAYMLRLPSASSASATGTATTRENTSPLAEAVDAVQREQPADVVHILIVQLGQHLVDHALREARLLLQPRAELLVFVRGSGI